MRHRQKQPAITPETLVITPDIGAVSRLVLGLGRVIYRRLQSDEVLPRPIAYVRSSAEGGYAARLFRIEAEGVLDWIEKGGMLVRFAGPRVAARIEVESAR